MTTVDAEFVEHLPAIRAQEEVAIQPWTPAFVVPVDEMVHRVAAKHEFFQRVMREGDHYGVIPGTSRKDEHGNDERFVLPTYAKDILAYARHPLETLGNKTHPLVSLMNDIFVKNKDYYGVEVRSRDASLPVQAGHLGIPEVVALQPPRLGEHRPHLLARVDSQPPAREVDLLVGQVDLLGG